MVGAVFLMQYRRSFTLQGRDTFFTCKKKPLHLWERSILCRSGAAVAVLQDRERGGSYVMKNLGFPWNFPLLRRCMHSLRSCDIADLSHYGERFLNQV